MNGRHFMKKGIATLKRVMSAVLVAVMLFTMVGVYIPADTFKAATTNITVRFKNTKNWSTVNAYMWGYGSTPGWPGVQATKDGEDYYWTGEWDTSKDLSIIFNNGSSQTVDLSIPASYLQGSTEWRFTPSGTEGEKITCTLDSVLEKKSDVKVYFSNTKNWSSVYAYAWDLNGAYIKGWPGDALTKEGDYYVYTVSEWNIYEPISIIFNNNSDSQTNDIVLSPADLIVSTEWKYTPKTSSAATKFDCDREAIVSKMYNYTIYIPDDWDVNKSAIHAWNSGAEGTDLTLSDGGTFKGTKWLKAEFKDALPSIGFLIKSKGDWTWQSADVTHTNTAGADQTLYYINGTLYTDLNDVPDLSQGGYMFVEYAGEPSEGKCVYSWANGYSESGFFVPFKETEDGTYIAKVPVKFDGENDRKLGFLVNSQPRWKDATKEGGDLFYTVDAETGYGKIMFSGGSIVKEMTAIKSSEIHRKDGYIAFNYRDNSAFAAEGIGYLGESAKVAVNVIEKTDTNTSEVKTYAMTYNKSLSAYTYNLNLTKDTDYYYYYTVDGETVEDDNTTKKAELESVSYSYNRNKVYNITVNVDAWYETMDYDMNNLITIEYEPKTSMDSMDGFKLEQVYLDLSELGLGSKVEVSKQYLDANADGRKLQISIGCADTVEPGEYTVYATLVDDCDMEYVGEVNVTVAERVKEEDDFDWDEAVIYFAVTDRFYDGNESNNTVTDDEETTTAYDKDNTLGVHGGDFAGLTEQLVYLDELGVNTIWITPIVDNIDKAVDGTNKSYAYHGYWAEDFTELNPHLGTEAELETLIEEAHNRGMKVMVDVVLNHSGYETESNEEFQIDTGYVDGSGNPIYKDMFRDEPIEGDDEKMSLSGLPDFETEDPEVRALLIAWQTAWITEDKFDIDYYRVDTVKHVDDTTWMEFKNELTKINPRFKLIGEYFDGGCKNDFNQLGTGMMDSILDFHFNDILKNLLTQDFAALEEALQNRNMMLNNTATMGSFLSSHDENGFLYDMMQTKDDWAYELMKVAATYQITAKGQPVIYYGEEIGQTGANNYPAQDNRYDFDWSEVESGDNAMLAHYQKMLNIRAKYSEVFAKGERYSVILPERQSDRNGTLKESGYEVFARSYEGKTIYVGTNVWDETQTVRIYVNGAVGSVYTDEYSGNTYTVGRDGSIVVGIPGARQGGTVVLTKTSGDSLEVEDTNEVTVVIHYKRTDYTDWNAWLWSDTLAGKGYEFTEDANGEMITSVTVDARQNTVINFKMRKGDWKEKDHDDKNQSIDISDIVSGTVHYYIESGIWGGTRSLGGDVVIGNKIVNSGYDRINNTFTITTSRPISGDPMTAFEIECTTTNTPIRIEKVTVNGSTYTLKINKDLTTMSEVLKSYQLTFEGNDYTLVMPNIYSTKEFEDAYTYDGDDLGLTYTELKSTFKVWAPTAESMLLNIYKSGTKGTDDLVDSYEMSLGEYGVWTYELEGDWNGYYYTYTVNVNNEVNEVCDPYARTTGVNGNRAMILDLDSTDPEGWEEDKDLKLHEGMSYTDAIIYELHVRDLSSDDSSGVSEENQGKFLGLTETGTTTPGGQSTGLDHIIDLGVTHVHLLPVYDYASVDETGAKGPQFNWGYDPQNYNVPEGSYSTDPYDGASRVNEMKQMVKALHDNNINVIMDVVYNHVYDAGTFGFNQLVPSYFSRTNADGTFSNGSGCGNDTATERSMVHKYVVESILYWHEEYHIDGFRFDLVGLLDTETINTIVEEVHKIDPDIIFYGEGWTLGTALSKDGYYMATQANAHMTPGFAYFSDTLRDNLAGNNTNGQGFIWVTGNVDILKYAFAGNSSWCPEPTQTINYASCHDNYTLMDKINEVSNALYNSYDDAPGAYQVKLNNLSAAYYMFAQGIPFIHAGEEFLRTKLEEDTNQVIHNSYNASDYVNTLRWYNLDGTQGDYALYADTVDYYKGLIEFRKNHEALRLTTDAQISEVLTTYTYENYLLAYKLDGTKVEGEVADEIVIIYNASDEERGVNIIENLGASTGTWNICVNAENAGAEGLGTIDVSENASWPVVEAHSVLVLVKGETIDTDSVYTKNNNVTISLDKTSTALQVGATAGLVATVNPANSTLIWTSSNEAVATVDEQGNVTAVGTGVATITVSTLHDVFATCVVNVSEPDESISLDKATLELTERATGKLTATVIPAGGLVTWTTSDSSIVTVDQTGKVTAVAPGTATITARTPKGATASCVVTVTHNMTFVEAVAPSCTAPGNIEHYACEGCGKFFLDEEGTKEITLADTVVAAKGHTITSGVVEKAPTCTEAGNIAYYECDVCNKLFSDEEGTKEITLADTVVAAKGHTITSGVVEKAPTCTEAGNIAYCECDVCNKLFLDKEGTKEITLADTVVAAKGHKLTKVEAKDATCTAAGNSAYYVCGTCNKLFSDAEGTKEITLADTVVAAKGHTITSGVAAKAPTCTEAGNIAYYECDVCNKLFSDEEGTKEITLADTVVAAKGHKLTKVEAKAPTTTATGNKAYYVCDTCGKLFLDAEGKNETTLKDVTLDKLPPEKPEDPKEDVVYVPENKVEEQVDGEADKLIDKIEKEEDLKDVVSDETLEKVQDAIANNEKITTELVIENMKDVDVDKVAKELVKEAIKALKDDMKSAVAQYIDIKVVLKTESSNEELGTLNKLSEEIVLTFEIPAEWKKVGRIFNVIRVHDGKTDVLDVWENEDGTVSFKTDRFSTYALVYTDPVEDEDPTPTPPADPEQPEPTPPDTGDKNRTGVYFLVLLAGFAMAIVGVKSSKRKYVK